MKLDRKGFMLAEVVVVAVVIATVLVTLYAGLNNVSSAYETRNRYYDVDALYVAMEINDILIREETINGLSNDSFTLLAGNSFGVDDFMNFYKDITGFDTYYTYVVPYNNEALVYLKNNGSDMENKITFKDYIDYLSGNLNFDDDYDYMIIVERENVNDKDDCYYYALKLKY